MHSLLPQGWKRPKGYANGVSATGRHIFVSGMIGWDANEVFHTDDFAGQARQALENIVAVLGVGGAKPAHSEIIGSYDIAMTAVQVSALMEDRAKVEIEVTAVVRE